MKKAAANIQGSLFVLSLGAGLAGMLAPSAALASKPEAVEVQTGHSIADIEAPQDHYVTIPIHASFYYSAEPWIETVLGSRPDGT
jgi:hypothetical protein